MPNCGPVVALVGAHTLPKRNLVSPISRMAGRPEITRYTLMTQHEAHRHDAAQQEHQVDGLLHGFAGAETFACMSAS